MNGRPVAGILLTLLVGGCMPSGSPPSDRATPAPVANGTSRPSAALPVGYGSLRLEDVSLDLAPGGLRIRVTPLHEDVTRLTAPDTAERLAAARARAGEGYTVFLVAVETERPGGVDFDPLDLEISSRGGVHRASSVQALTSGWGAGRLEQRSPQQALYLFPPSLDPTDEWVARFGDVRNDGWAARLPRMDAERARVRARAGGGTQASSSPNFLILR